MTDQRTADEIAQDNHAHFVDRGPGLSYGYSSYVDAIDINTGRIRIGGLGGMGAGQSTHIYQRAHDYSDRGRSWADALVSAGRLWRDHGRTANVGGTVIRLSWRGNATPPEPVVDPDDLAHLRSLVRAATLAADPDVPWPSLPPAEPGSRSGSAGGEMTTTDREER